MDLILGALKIVSTGNRAMYSGTTLPTYELLTLLIGISMEGGGCWTTYRLALRTIQPVCWGGIGFANKNGYIAGGGLVIRSLFFHSYFPYYVFDAYSNGSKGGIFLAFSKKGVFNLGVCFFFSDLEIATLNFLVFLVFLKWTFLFHFFVFFKRFRVFYFFQIFKN